MGGGASSAAAARDAIANASIEEIQGALATLPDNDRQRVLALLKGVWARQATGPQRPPGNHGCKPVEIVSGVWTAHFQDIDSEEKLKAVSPTISLVVNTAVEKCDTKTGFYGDGVTVLRVENFLDTPEAHKNVDMMPEGPEKEAAKAALPPVSAEEAPGNATKEFETVNTAIDAAKASGGGAILHCYASMSRSAVFILAYLMKAERISLVDAIGRMKEKWDATWPNDDFMDQLVQYEMQLQL